MPHADPTPPAQPWWRELSRYHWFVFIVAAVGWLADCMDQQLFNLARVPAMRELLVRSAGENDAQFNARVAEYAGYSTSIFLMGWAAGGLVSMPLFTGGLIENQVKEAAAQEAAAFAQTANIEQALTQQVTNAYLDTITFTQQIKLAEDLVKTAQEALSLAKQRYKLGLGSIVEVTQSEVGLTAAQTRLAEAQYDYKIAEATLLYAAGGDAQLQLDPVIR